MSTSKERAAHVHRIRAALQSESFTSGTCPVSVDSLNLHYRLSKTDKTAHVLNLANATPDELQGLNSACDAAPFGRGNQTVMDESYRKALKLDLAQFCIPFELSEVGIVNKIQQDLVDPPDAIRRSIRTELYKLNIYDKGSFFKAHKDTPRDETMFGSLVIIFPTEHEGGNLLLTEGDEQWDFDGPSMLQGSTPDAPSIAWVALYSNVTHEVLPVTSGARVTLTYNLYFKGVDTIAETTRSSKANSKYVAIKDSLGELADAHADTHLFAFGLAHGYPIQIPEEHLSYNLDELKYYLKGSDALVYAACQELGLKISLKVLYDNNYHPDSYYMSSYIADPGEDQVESESDIYQGMECLEDVPMTWVTPFTRNTSAESHYVAYGNEASLGRVYGSVCMMASRKTPKLRRNYYSDMEEEDEEDYLSS